MAAKDTLSIYLGSELREKLDHAAEHAKAEDPTFKLQDVAKQALLQWLSPTETGGLVEEPSAEPSEEVLQLRHDVNLLRVQWFRVIEALGLDIAAQWSFDDIVARAVEVTTKPLINVSPVSAPKPQQWRWVPSAQTHTAFSEIVSAGGHVDSMTSEGDQYLIVYTPA